MSWEFQALGGPVLAWEIKRATRGKLWRGLQFGYCAWLVVSASAFFWVAFSASRALEDPGPPYQLGWEPLPRRELYRALFAQQIWFLDSYFQFLLQFQLVLAIGIVPVLTAGSLGQEKERGTLFALFGTELTSPQIVLGKLLGRLMLIMPLVLTTLPALVFLTTLTGRGLSLVMLALAQEAAIAIALGAAALLFAIWIRRAADAVIASYLFLGLAALIIRWFTAFMAEANWFDPIENLRKLLNDQSRLMFVAHLAVWVSLGFLCLHLGWRRLRKVCVEQHDKKPSRRLWAFRPAVGNHPIRWRECHVIGLAPLPILRIVPRWLALLLVFTFSATVAGMIANHFSQGFITAEAVGLMGLVFTLSANVLVGVRCGTSVAEEKRRNTWDDLLLTAQSFREITTGKMWGVLQATFPYIIAYTLPVMFFAWRGGPYALLTAGLWMITPCVIVFCAALRGIDMIRVPPDMDETRQGGAFWFEKD